MSQEEYDELFGYTLEPRYLTWKDDDGTVHVEVEIDTSEYVLTDKGFVTINDWTEKLLNSV